MFGQNKRCTLPPYETTPVPETYDHLLAARVARQNVEAISLRWGSLNVVGADWFDVRWAD